MIVTFKKMFLVIIVLSIAAFNSNETQAQGAINNSAVENSIIIIIHGDGNYLFHNRKGKPFLADDVALQKAIRASERLNNAEVFIFHQKKKNYSFLFFPDNDLDFYYYKSGILLKQASMQRSSFDFSEEINFYKQLSSKSLNKTLLYYGHEIPLTGGYGYNSSYKDEQFNMSVFSGAVKKFSPDEKFKLIVLSTCSNGSPAVIKELYTEADYIIASPDDLHLSYMNPLNLKKLNYYRNYNFEDFVVAFAKSSFRELKRTVETTTVISAYKTDKLSEHFLNNVADIQSIPQDKIRNVNNCDCAEIKNFNSEEASAGVIVFYNPSSFGNQKYKTGHSGWGCKRSNDYTSLSIMEKVLKSKQPD